MYKQARKLQNGVPRQLILFIFLITLTGWLTAGPTHGAKVEVSGIGGRLVTLDVDGEGSSLVWLRYLLDGDHVHWERGIEGRGGLSIESIHLLDHTALITGTVEGRLMVGDQRIPADTKPQRFFVVFDLVDGRLIRAAAVRGTSEPLLLRVQGGESRLQGMLAGRPWHIPLETDSERQVEIIDVGRLQMPGLAPMNANGGGAIFILVEDLEGTVVDPNGPPN